MATSNATCGSDVVTLTQTSTVQPSAQQACTLVLRKPKTEKKIKWTEETVDNEDMGKKKSKCCCIYTKPKLFGESSSESESSDDETNHCKGHKGKCYQHSSGPQQEHKH
ncbi:E3 ubiquitin-protein ligase PPP1R11-like [Watersipora subatra]|uniref:E3 ubiquitin-protein ligase PPP1R11-like n=1 Tax=Watersipora subatra TaxID=2589382 RepID=UPI00355C0555